LGIILVSLHPNAVRLLQPADVATFNPQKLGWKTAVLDWHRQNSYKILNREWFAPVLDGACDLCPWNPENTDFKMSWKKSSQKCTIQKPQYDQTIKNI